MKKRIEWISIPLLTAALGCFGCVKQAPVIAGTPTPTCSPTPLAEVFSPILTTSPAPKDALGNRLGDDNHYFRYLSFSNILIYEYETGTFLDGSCTNLYSEPLKGRIDISYHNKEGKLCGIGTIHSADGSLVFQPGTNNVYAEILTDIDVTGMDYTIEIIDSFEPVL